MKDFRMNKMKKKFSKKLKKNIKKKKNQKNDLLGRKRRRKILAEEFLKKDYIVYMEQIFTRPFNVNHTNNNNSNINNRQMKVDRNPLDFLKLMP